VAETPDPPVEPTLESVPREDERGRALLRIALPFYGIVALFAVGFALFSAGITRLFGEVAARPTGLLGGLGVGLGLVALTRVGASGWAPMVRMTRSLEELVGPITWTTALLLALVSGFAEELLFRGALWPHLGLIGTTLLFGLIHVLPRRSLWLYPVFATLAGLFLGLVREGTGSVWPPIVAHVTVNALNLAWLGTRARRALLPPPEDA